MYPQVLFAHQKKGKTSSYVRKNFNFLDSEAVTRMTIDDSAGEKEPPKMIDVRVSRRK